MGTTGKIFHKARLIAKEYRRHAKRTFQDETGSLQTGKIGRFDGDMPLGTLFAKVGAVEIPADSFGKEVLNVRIFK